MVGLSGKGVCASEVGFLELESGEVEEGCLLGRESQSGVLDSNHVGGR